ncbi:MAG TPA: hypothetical protein VGX94_12075 [Terriglobia bacterium]|nr:hypothetical protein [Terriglobia bacterium]
MRIITVVVCTSLASTLLCAQPGSNAKFDGIWWNGLSDVEKIGFVVGWSGARGDTVLEECANDPALSAHLRSCVDKQFKLLQIPNDYTYGQLKDGIDKLYADYRNRLIIVDNIAEEVEKQINGASDQQIETDLEEDRKIAQRLESQ